jgi:general secretion pathway protein A
VSTTLKGYLTNAVTFYDQLFQRFAAPAHSYDSDDTHVEKTVTTSTELQNQQRETESHSVTVNSTEIEPPIVENSSSPNKQSLSPQDCTLVIPFDYNSNDVPESAYDSLEKCASIMSQDPTLVMVIKGYTDNAGSYTYNKKLSTFRANIVKSYLIGKGVSPKRIEAVGMGEESPIEENSTEAGRRANRRVEVEIVTESN